MNIKSLKTLEYNKIINTLTAYASSSLGKERCKELLPSQSLAAIQKMQTETSDALTRILQKGTISFSGIKDIRPSLMSLEVGSTLGVLELLNISSLLLVTLRVKSYSRRTNNHQSFQEEDAMDNPDEKSDSLAQEFYMLEPLTPLCNEIQRCIISEEEISDDASTELKRIRRSIKNTNNKIHEQLNTIVKSSSTRTMLQETIITMRNDRYCLPVKAEYRNQFNGMIHDQSSTGSTLFIEPMAIVKLNNDLKELASKEQEEIQHILERLSALAGGYTDALRENLSILTNLDFIFAKASLSKKWKASEPIFNEKGYINIKKGRHPLINNKDVVPIDIYMGKDFHLLIVTGPNTGGKTVSLKTVGLFTLMGQAGLHIPAFDRSELAVFEEVFADIGDEQSIEQSLSTFSSHMLNTISILEQANSKSLVLFDELGAGTDPTEGAALAMSILSHFHKNGIRTMATTHYSELKVFALSTEGIENASCEFNVSTLLPTYRLLIGIPGKSNAFSISSKLGLPDFIIEDAKLRIDAQDQSFEDVISDLEASRISLEKEHAQVNQYKQEVENLKLKLKADSEKLSSTKDKIISQANEKSREILQEAKDYADDTIRKYNKWMKNGGVGKDMENQRNSLRNKLNDAESNIINKNKKTSSKNYKPSDFKLGDAVHVLTLDLRGTVSSLPNQKGNLFVQMGILRSQINIKDLELIDEEVVTSSDSKRTGSSRIKMDKSTSISPEINLIGKMVADAIPVLDKYLDDAYLSHLPQVTVIHGRGTGALKNAVHAHLKKAKYVKSYRLGVFGEGDQGVTIVEFN
jgi:DNA mismatch repair protein MutS2